MPKRKRSDEEYNSKNIDNDSQRKPFKCPEKHHDLGNVQIITGSYDKTLHGIIATISSNPSSEETIYEVNFTDNFLFNAHTSAIRCLAISPPAASSKTHQPERLILASGSTDERINVYSISTSTRSLSRGRPLKPSGSTGTTDLLNPSNKELGSLLHHASSINVLHFPSHAKLLSGADDNTIAISRTRDWSVLSTIKIPVPRLVGRPSGDTAGPGEAPSGVNDFAVHPSQKLMITVSKGERCMRLWNLVTGKRAGVLNFDKGILQEVGESKWSRGEGRKVEWSSAGTEFAIAFERGIIVFGVDSETKAVIVPKPRSKIHKMHYITHLGQNLVSQELLTFSTEDGRVLFYSSDCNPSKQFAPTSENNTQPPVYHCVGYLGGTSMGVGSRIKDFEYVDPASPKQKSEGGVMITAGSDGIIRLWFMPYLDLRDTLQSEHAKAGNGTPGEATGNGLNGGMRNLQAGGTSAIQRGVLIGTYETGSRITCMKAIPLQHSVHKQGTVEEFEGFDS